MAVIARPLNANVRAHKTAMQIPADFTESKAWPTVLDERAAVRAEPAVYALLHERDFGRLRGASRILYIGSTGQLGGTSESCRLRIYRYPNGRHALELQRKVQLLLAAGVTITLYWKHVRSKDDAELEEARLLREYMSEHCELPPFNGRNEGAL
jgi:hypothetical protein